MVLVIWAGKALLMITPPGVSAVWADGCCVAAPPNGWPGWFAPPEYFFALFFRDIGGGEVDFEGGPRALVLVLSQPGGGFDFVVTSGEEGIDGSGGEHIV